MEEREDWRGYVSQGHCGVIKCVISESRAALMRLLPWEDMTLQSID